MGINQKQKIQEQAMGNKDLQQLSKEYSNQEIDTLSYREKRSELLNSITGQTTSEFDEESNAGKTGKDSDRRKWFSKLAITLVQIVLLIALVLGFFYFF